MLCIVRAGPSRLPICQACGDDAEVNGRPCSQCPRELPAPTTPRERMRAILVAAFTPAWPEAYLAKPHGPLNAELWKLARLEGVPMKELAEDMSVSPTRIKQRVDDAAEVLHRSGYRWELP